MNIHTSDQVLVNVAPFIASPRRQRDAVPCDVLEVDAMRVRVATRRPYRKVELWVEMGWIDAVLQGHELVDSPSSAPRRTSGESARRAPPAPS